MEVQVAGQMIFNTSPQLLTAALEDWSRLCPGYHLYYPSRKHSSPAFKRVIDALRS